jgi:hypothetical protein
MKNKRPKRIQLEDEILKGKEKKGPDPVGQP